MKPYFNEHGSTILHGDCRKVMKRLEDNRFTTVITDPPYELGFMGKKWDATGVAFCADTWAEVLRVCKPGAILLAFGGTRTWHRLACAIEDAGWEIRDSVLWLYGSGFPKSLDISKAIDKAAGAEREVVGKSATHTTKQMNGGAYNGNQYRDAVSLNITAPATADAKLWQGWGTALKPAWEPVVLAMKPLDGTFAENALAHGVAGLNIDGARIPGAVDDGRDFDESPLNAGRAGNKNVFGDATLRNYKPSNLGRWPANVILDEVAAELLNQQTGTLTSGGGNANGRIRGGHNSMNPWLSPDTGTHHGDSGGASRFFYTAKASRSDRGAGNDHPTVKPTDLIKYLCTLTATPDGGEILDPFGGSMTTLVAARETGRKAVAIELEESHCAIGAKRLSQGVLFGAA